MARRYTPDTANKMFLGRQGENLAREYAFDFSAWKEQYGEGEISLLAQRCGDDAPYPVAIKVEGDKAIWTVTNADTAVVGAGKCELRYTVDDVIVKSATYKTKVMPSLSGEPRPAPAPHKSWVAEVFTARDEAVAAADEAQSYSTNPPIVGGNGNWWEWNGTDYVDTGKPSQGEKGDKGETGDKGESGETGAKGEDGKDGVDGYTPVRGTDYWTSEDIAEIKSYVDDAILGGAW